MRPFGLRSLLWLIVCLTLFPLGVMAQPTTKMSSVPNAPDQICPLPIGSALPALQLQGLDAKPFDLATAIKAKPTILIYFRGGW